VGSAAPSVKALLLSIKAVISVSLFALQPARKASKATVVAPRRILKLAIVGERAGAPAVPLLLTG